MLTHMLLDFTTSSDDVKKGEKATAADSDPKGKRPMVVDTQVQKTKEPMPAAEGFMQDARTAEQRERTRKEAAIRKGVQTRKRNQEMEDLERKKKARRGELAKRRG